MSQVPKSYVAARNDLEAELAQIDAETARMSTELSELATRRLTVVTFFNAARAALGEVVPESNTVGGDLESREDEDIDGLSLVARNAFRALGPSQAAVKYLRLREQRVTHAELVKALEKGNVKSGSKRPSDSIRNALSRRPDLFVWIKEPAKVGRWGLKEWQKTEESPSEKTSDPAASSRPLSLVG